MDDFGGNIAAVVVWPGWSFHYETPGSGQTAKGTGGAGSTGPWDGRAGNTSIEASSERNSEW